MNQKKPKKSKKEPERLKIEGDWKDAIKKALETTPNKEKKQKK